MNEWCGRLLDSNFRPCRRNPSEERLINISRHRKRLFSISHATSIKFFPLSYKTFSMRLMQSIRWLSRTTSPTQPIRYLLVARPRLRSSSLRRNSVGNAKEIRHCLDDPLLVRTQIRLDYGNLSMSQLFPNTLTGGPARFRCAPKNVSDCSARDARNSKQSIYHQRTHSSPHTIWAWLTMQM
jgi:hypothetical protein